MPMTERCIYRTRLSASPFLVMLISQPLVVAQHTLSSHSQCISKTSHATAPCMKKQTSLSSTDTRDTTTGTPLLTCSSLLLSWRHVTSQLCPASSSQIHYKQPFHALETKLPSILLTTITVLWTMSTIQSHVHAYHPTRNPTRA